MNFLELVEDAIDRGLMEPKEIAIDIYSEIDADTWLSFLTSQVGTAQANIRRAAFFPTPATAKATKTPCSAPSVTATTNSKAARIRIAWPDTVISVNGKAKRVRDLTAEDLKFKIQEIAKTVAGHQKTLAAFEGLLTQVEQAKVATVGELDQSILNDEAYFG